MSSDQDVRVNIDERKIGKAAGKATGQEIRSEIQDLKDQTKRTTRAVEALSDDIAQLKSRIHEIEQTKAQAERKALEDLKETLKQQVDEKRREYKRQVTEVLDDYRGSIERLKNRFLSSISGQGDQFDDVEAEFNSVLAARSDVVERTTDLSEPASETYSNRMKAVIEAKNDFHESINTFLEDREDTAETIDSLQTSVSGIQGTATVAVPFWVVGIERDGREELVVHSTLDRGDVSESPTRERPYVDRLQPHSTHGYTEMEDAVHSYVSRDAVRDALAERDDGAFVNPECLEEDGVAQPRFVEALRDYALDRGATSRPSEPAHDKADAMEVTADD